MKKSYSNIERRGLPGGPNEEINYSNLSYSTQGYKRFSPDVNNPFNLINSGRITMKDVDFPVTGIDDLGYRMTMMPDEEYEFPGDEVLEIPHRNLESLQPHHEDHHDNIHAFAGVTGDAVNHMGVYGGFDTKHFGLHGSYVKPLQQIAHNSGDMHLSAEYRGGNDRLNFNVGPTFNMHGGHPSFGVQGGLRFNFQPGGEIEEDMMYSQPIEDIISDRENDSYEYKRSQDPRTGAMSYYQRKKGSNTWRDAGKEGSTGYRAVTNVFGDDKTGYANSPERARFMNKMAMDYRMNDEDYIRGLMDKANHPLDLVYGNSELGIPAFGEKIKSMPQYQDDFFDPYGDEEDKYIQYDKQGTTQEERDAAQKRVRQNYLSNVGRTEEEDQIYEAKRQKEIDEEHAKWRAQRDADRMEMGHDGFGGNVVGGWEYTGQTPDEYYKDLHDPGYYDIAQASGFNLLGEVTGFYDVARVAQDIDKRGWKEALSDGDNWKNLGMAAVGWVPGIGWAGKGAKVASVANKANKVRKVVDKGYDTYKKVIDPVNKTLNKIGGTRTSNKLLNKMNMGSLNDFNKNYMKRTFIQSDNAAVQNALDKTFDVTKKFGLSNDGWGALTAYGMYGAGDAVNRIAHGEGSTDDYVKASLNFIPGGNIAKTLGTATYGTKTGLKLLDKSGLFDDEKNQRQIAEQNNPTNATLFQTGGESGPYIGDPLLGQTNPNWYSMEDDKATIRDNTNYFSPYPQAIMDMSTLSSSGAPASRVAPKKSTGLSRIFGEIWDNGIGEIKDDIKDLINPKNYRVDENGNNYRIKEYSTQNYPTKDDAFAAARKELGPGKEFLYNHVRYKTDYYGETEDKGTQKILSSLKSSIGKEDGITENEYARFVDLWNQTGQPDIAVGSDDSKFHFGFLTPEEGYGWSDLPMKDYDRYKRDHINPLNQKMFLPSKKDLWDKGELGGKELLDRILYELGHNWQIRERGTGEFAKEFLANKTALGLANKEKEMTDWWNKKWNPDFKPEKDYSDYKTPGMLEYQAHEEITPRFMEYVYGDKYRESDHSGHKHGPANKNIPESLLIKNTFFNSLFGVPHIKGEGNPQRREYMERNYGHSGPIRPTNGMYKRKQGGELSKAQEGGESGISNLNDLYISPSDFKVLNKAKDDSNPYYCSPGDVGCLASSYDAYDKLVGQRYRSDEFLSEQGLKKSLGLQSLRSYQDDSFGTGYDWDPETNDFVYYDKDVETKRYKPGSTTHDWIMKYKDYFQKGYEGEEQGGGYDFTADSWDIHGILVDQGGENIFTGGTEWDNYNQSGNIMTPEKLKNLYSKMTPGTIIGFNNYNKGLNPKKGLTGSGHSTQVIGYDERGVPVIYDFGDYLPIDKLGLGEGGLYAIDAISNITIPKEHIGKNLEWAKEKGHWTGEDPKDLNLNLEPILSQWGQDDDELPDFYAGLKDEKFNLMDDLNLKEGQYDQMAAALIGIAMEETEGGGGIQHNIEQLLPGTSGQKTSGLTQLMWSNIEDDAKLKKIAKKYGITKQSDLKDSKKSAIASMIYGSRNYLAAQKNLQAGKKEGVRTYYPPTWKGKLKDWQKEVKGDGIIYDGKEFVTEGGGKVDFFSGINMFGAGYYDDLETINKNLEEAAQKEGNPGRYTARYETNDDGDEVIVIDKKTFGNADLDPIDAFIYNWNSPYALTSGDAQGGAAYVNNVKGYMDQIKIKQTGGEITPEHVQEKQRVLEEELGKLEQYNLNPAQKMQLTESLISTYNDTVPYKFKMGGTTLSPELQMYKNYIIGKDESEKARKNYDKLNRVHYKEAKLKNMKPANFIMTELIS